MHKFAVNLLDIVRQNKKYQYFVFLLLTNAFKCTIICVHENLKTKIGETFLCTQSLKETAKSQTSI